MRWDTRLHYLRHHSRLVYHTPACNPVTNAGRYQFLNATCTDVDTIVCEAAVWLAVKTGSRLVQSLYMFFKRKEKKEEPVQEEVVQDTGELLANAKRNCCRA